MIIAIDTNVLLDILIPDSAHMKSSLACLMDTAADDDLVICEVVYAELGAQFPSPDALNRFLRETGIKLLRSDRKALLEAGVSWKKYCARKKGAFTCGNCGKQQEFTCSFCSNVISGRRHILSDFLVGAHAQVQAAKLISRDRGFHRTYFQKLEVVTPGKERDGDGKNR